MPDAPSPPGGNAAAPFPPDLPAPPWEQLFELVPAMVAYYSREGMRCRFANASYAQMYGLGTRQIVGMQARDIMGEIAWRQLQPNLDRAVQGERMTYVRDHVDPDGEMRNVEVHLLPHRDTTGQVHGAFLFMNDITALRQRELEAQARAEHLIGHDPLTNLPRPATLFDQFNEMLRFAHPPDRHVGVFCLDLDHFRSINDALGRNAGDALLRTVAERLRSVLRPQDLLTRLGGDQFLIIIPQLSSRVEAKTWASRLLETLHAVLTLQGEPLKLMASVGVSLFPGDGDDTDALLRHADAAMRRAKAAGRGRVRFYEPQMAPPGLEALHQEYLLRESVEQDEFEVHYQPQLRLSDGQLDGLEALVRWRHPQQGLLAPHHFIALAEARSLIGAIARSVLAQCCRHMLLWREAGLPPVRVAVNVSALEFHQRNLLAEVPETLRHYGIEPQWLELELTESVMMRSSHQEMETLHRLKGLGMSIAIDDFGTGFASLSYVRDYPADTLKLDRSFITGLPADGKDRAIVQAVLRLAQGLGMRTVAEGVQHPQQLRWLRDEGCMVAQGFVIAPPMDAQAIQSWMQTHARQPFVF